MPNHHSPIRIATRGSALALAQAHNILDQCQAVCPDLPFELKIIKTTGDKMQTASMADPGLAKGLFTKELEVALLQNEADLAVHSLKDLPTDLPAGLVVGAVSARAEVRDVLIRRSAGLVPAAGQCLASLPQGATVATSSTRRRAQLLYHRPDLEVVPLRGNVPTRLRKLAEQSQLDAIILAAAGLHRLGFVIGPEGRLVRTGSLSTSSGPDQGSGPANLQASLLSLEEMLPCVGQAAIGLEIRENDDRVAALCRQLNHAETHLGVTAERAFLRAMGGGCQLPVAAYAQVHGPQLRLRALSFLDNARTEAEAGRPRAEAEELGRQVAAILRPSRA